ncbi:MAG: 7-cyano-7-deazaguanine synthase QueC [Phycisphaeraceae bacterium]
MAFKSEISNQTASTAAQRLQSAIHRPAVVLLSGGLDSATTLAIARSDGYVCHALSFDYGQRHRIELAAAHRVADHLGVASHRWVTIDLRAFGHSALTDNIPVPKDRGNLLRDSEKSEIRRPQQRKLNPKSEIPLTYVPARNTIFLSYALALAEVLDSTDIFIGVNAVDYSGYPDCRPQYIAAFQQMANFATRAGVEGHALTIHTPLIDWSKTRIIQCGLELGVDYSLTHSCYDPDEQGRACGRCDSCLLRQQAFESLGMRDPVRPPLPRGEGWGEGTQG